MAIELDIVETGFYQVLKNGKLVSQHSKEKKAVARALEETALDNNADIQIVPPIIKAVAEVTNINNGSNEDLLQQIQELENEKQELMETINELNSKNLLFVNSRIEFSKIAEPSDANGINLIISNTDVEITVLNNLDLPVGSIIIYKQNEQGNVIIKGDLETKQTYSKDDTISIFKNDEENWEYLNPPKRKVELVTNINSQDINKNSLNLKL